jgi:hypothetical protein
VTINKLIEPEGKKDAELNAPKSAPSAVAKIVQTTHTVIDALGKRIEDLPPGKALDATQILGFGPASEEALPVANPGEIVIRSGGWSLPELGEKFPNLFTEKPSDLADWSSEKLPSGILTLRLGRKIFYKQEVFLDGEPPPVALMATALLAIQLSGDEYPFGEYGYTTCKEQLDGYPVLLDRHDGLLHLRTDYRAPNIDYFPTHPKTDA